MNTLTAARANEHRLDPHAIHNMHRLRHRVFHERLGWEVPSQKGLERDEYDDLAPVYLVARGPSRRVEGCMRLLPTTGPYMLRDTFPQLLAGETAPVSPHIWDVSRFAVARPSRGARGQGMINELTVDLVLGVVDYALAHDISHYVAVVSVGLERIFRRVGLPTRRFGDGQARRVGKALSVAVWIEMNKATRESVISRNRLRNAA
jgi:acyl homoserine lactone synthase